MKHALKLLVRKLATLMLAVGLFVVAGCRQDEAPTESVGMGGIRLALTSEPDVYVATRAEKPLTDIGDLEFLLSGTSAESGEISLHPIQFIAQGDGNCTAVFEVGTYTLTVRTKKAVSEGAQGNSFGAPFYSGTTTQFQISKGADTSVSLALGAPQNTKISTQTDASFAALYDLADVTLEADGRTAVLSDPAHEAYFAVPADGKISYTIHAAAKAGSHAQEIAESGITGSLTVEAGHAYTLTLKANPVTGILLPVVGGEHNGTFDVKRHFK